jgi:hypothetical protein
MENKIKIGGVLNTTNPLTPLGVEIWVDNDQVFNTEHLEDSCKFEHYLDDSEGNHELRFVLKNKLPSHTVVDDNGNIISDSTISINDISFDEILVGSTIVTNIAVYTHAFNGDGEKTQNKFYSEMGCNGEVSLKFTTPVYVWLLENM